MLASGDTRDMRDPQALGNALLKTIGRKRHRSKQPDRMTAAKVYDKSAIAGDMDVPDYAPDESIATLAARAYRDELETRAMHGDKYAVSMLKGDGPIDDGGE